MMQTDKTSKSGEKSILFIFEQMVHSQKKIIEG